MASVFKNIILMLILSAAIIMMIGIVFYDYIPNGVEVKDAQEYVATENTTKMLEIIKTEETELFGSASSGTNTVEKPATVIQAYTLDAIDLKVYEQENSYISGKADPFDEISSVPSKPSTGNGTTSNNSIQNNTLNNSVSTKGDGTLFNSATSK